MIFSVHSKSGQAQQEKMISGAMEFRKPGGRARGVS